MSTKCSCRGCGKEHDGKKCRGCSTNLLPKPGPGCDRMYHSVVASIQSQGITCGVCKKKVPESEYATHRCFVQKGTP